MDSLVIEPTYWVVLGTSTASASWWVGTGGTGSTLALFLAGLAFHARQKGIQVELTLVDHDVVELKNCGRQAVSLQAALRLNAAYGLDITTWPQPYVVGMAHSWFHHGTGGRDCAHLMIGCVDNHLARREMARTVELFDDRLWAIDSGNEQNSGQVLIGNLADGRKIKTDPLGLCSGLPSPICRSRSFCSPIRTPRPNPAPRWRWRKRRV